MPKRRSQRTKFRRHQTVPRGTSSASSFVEAMRFAALERDLFSNPFYELNLFSMLLASNHSSDDNFFHRSTARIVELDDDSSSETNNDPTLRNRAESAPPLLGDRDNKNDQSPSSVAPCNVEDNKNDHSSSSVAPCNVDDLSVKSGEFHDVKRFKPTESMEAEMSSSCSYVSAKSEGKPSEIPKSTLKAPKKEPDIVYSLRKLFAEVPTTSGYTTQGTAKEKGKKPMNSRSLVKRGKTDSTSEKFEADIKETKMDAVVTKDSTNKKIEDIACSSGPNEDSFIQLVAERSKKDPRVKSTIKKLLTVLSPDKKLNVRYEFLEYMLLTIEDLSDVHFKKLQEKMKFAILPKELREIEYEESDIIEHEIIGMGSFGVVGRCTLTRTDGKKEIVAVKTAIKMGSKIKFLDEAKLMLKLQHPNILKIIGITTTVDDLFMSIITEYMSHGNVVLYIQQNLNTKLRLKLLYDIATGLEYIHQEKYIHRDITSNNIFVNSKDVPKIGDFGMCKYVGNTGGKYVETELATEGYWRAPEVLTRGENYYASDRFSLSILAIEMFLVSDKVLQTTINRHMLMLQELIPGFEVVRDQCPREVYDIIVEGLCKNPERRPPISALKATLKKYF